jgi:hypothetical protein
MSKTFNKTLNYNYNGSISLGTSGNVSATNMTATNVVGTNISAGIITVSGTVIAVNITTTNLIDTNLTAGVARVTGNLSAVGNSNTVGAIITTGGNVGIGTTSPAYTLDVNGSARINSTAGLLLGTSTDLNNNRLISALNNSMNTGGTGYITFGRSNDTNNQAELGFNYIGNNNASNSLTLGLFGGEKMRVQGNGNIGIGTTSPSGRLHVFEATGTAPGGNAGSIVVSRGNTGGSSSITFLSTINPNSDFGYIQFIESVTNSGFTGYNYFGGTSNEAAALLIGCENDGSLVSGPDSVIISPVGNVAITPRNNVTYVSGNVGIGTTSPNYTLDVAGTIRATNGVSAGQYIYASNSAGALVVGSDVSAIGSLPSTQIYISGNRSATQNCAGVGFQRSGARVDSIGVDTNNNFVVSIQNTTDNLFFKSNTGDYNNTTGGNFLMTLQGAGNVGIGTTSPGYTLDVNGTTRTKNFTVGTSGNLGSTFFAATISADATYGQNPLAMFPVSDTNYIIAFYNTANSVRGTILGNGSNGVLYNTTSDRRRKTNITDMPSMKEKIKKLRPRSFEWKDTYEPDDGFIAQEIHQVFPQFRAGIQSYCDNCNLSYSDLYNGVTCDCFDFENPIDKNGEPHYYGLDYGKFTPYLTKALQETITDLETSQAIINAQQAKIDQLVTFIQTKFPGEFTG